MTLLDYEDCILPLSERRGFSPLTDSMLSRPLIYVAAFYNANPAHGLAEAAAAFNVLFLQGWLPLVPHTTFLLDVITPRDPKFWYAYDLALLRRADAMYVCGSEATGESEGVTKEILAATVWGIPVFYSERDAETYLARAFHIDPQKGADDGQVV